MLLIASGLLHSGPCYVHKPSSSNYVVLDISSIHLNGLIGILNQGISRIGYREHESGDRMCLRLSLLFLCSIGWSGATQSSKLLGILNDLLAELEDLPMPESKVYGIGREGVGGTTINSTSIEVMIMRDEQLKIDDANPETANIYFLSYAKHAKGECKTVQWGKASPISLIYEDLQRCSDKRYDGCEIIRGLKPRTRYCVKLAIKRQQQPNKYVFDPNYKAVTAVFTTEAGSA